MAEHNNTSIMMMMMIIIIVSPATHAMVTLHSTPYLASDCAETSRRCSSVLWVGISVLGLRDAHDRKHWC